ncbi:hypothetical protein RF11_10003 [Thelohanellus kitauei]|uniref:Uncharacterized protein n=1 Tax=Thelohanellus kitauei TaxID=669202 RepID=A0A0C2MNL0_THEKT|nr:hypothetical protein RF11_10003 [Thelohanellus kitauei]
MDELKDISDTYLVAVFVKTINNNIYVIQELLGRESLLSTTTVSERLESLKNPGEKKILNGVNSLVYGQIEQRNSALNRRVFRQFLSDLKDEYCELVLNRQVKQH